MSVRSLRYNTIEQHFTKGVTASTDRDALAFLEAAQIYNANQQRAIVNLVRSLKRVGLWSKMKAIYPFVGGTATSHKFNLKDPRDVDAAFRLIFYGGWTHSANGALPNGTTSYSDTQLKPASHLSNNNTHISYYSRTDAKSGAPTYVATGTDFGTLTSYSAPIPILQIVIRGDYAGTARASSYQYVAANEIILNQSTGLGLFTSSRTSSTSHKYYRNTTTLGTDTSTSSSFSSLTFPLFLAARNDAGTAYQYSNKECAFATIGDGLTDTDATNLYNIVDLYQKRLGRNV